MCLGFEVSSDKKIDRWWFWPYWYVNPRCCWFLGWEWGTWNSSESRVLSFQMWGFQIVEENRTKILEDSITKLSLNILKLYYSRSSWRPKMDIIYLMIFVMGSWMWTRMTTNWQVLHSRFFHFIWKGFLLLEFWTFIVNKILPGMTFIYLFLWVFYLGSFFFFLKC